MNVDDTKKYPKQIILISSNRDQVGEKLKENGFYVIWCPFELSKIIEVRDRSNVLFLNITEEDSDNLKRIGLYLRDLCIEEEKVLYIYGKVEGVDIIRSRIPSIFIRRSAYVFSDTLVSLLEDLKKLTVFQESHLPGLLIVDDDVEYVEKLRPHLEHCFRIYVSHRDLIEAGIFLHVSDIVLVNADAEYKLINFLDFFRAIYSRKRSNGIRLYYLADNNDSRDSLNLGSDRDGIVLLKSYDISKTASFLMSLATYGQ